MTTVEHIELQAHPLETWARALDALIACAPGAHPEIATYLFRAARRVNGGVPPTLATDLQRRCAAKLMVATTLAAEAASSRRTVCEFPRAPRQPHQADRTASAASRELLHSTAAAETESAAAGASAAPVSVRPQPQQPLQGASTPEPVHLSGLPVRRDARPFRFLRW